MNRPWLGPAAILAMLGFSAALLPQLPEQVPAHWPASGEVERWTGRWSGAFRLPAWALVIWSIIRVVPGLDPERPPLERYRDLYWMALNLIVLGFALAHFLRMVTALGWELGPDHALLLWIGVLFLGLADQVRGLAFGSPVGVRTPWAMKSAFVWRETHRLAAMTFLAAGLLTLGALLLPDTLRPWAALAVLLFGGFTPVAYSYVLHRAGAEKAGNAGSTSS